MDFKEVSVAMDEYERLSTKRQEIEANLKRLREETERLMIARDQLNAEIKVYLLAEDPVLERRVDWKAMQPRVYGQLRYYEFEDGHQIETYRDLISLTPWELTDFRSFGFRALELLEEHLDLDRACLARWNSSSILEKQDRAVFQKKSGQRSGETIRGVCTRTYCRSR